MKWEKEERLSLGWAKGYNIPIKTQREEEQMAGDAIILIDSNSTLMASVFSVMYGDHLLKRREGRKTL